MSLSTEVVATATSTVTERVFGRVGLASRPGVGVPGRLRRVALGYVALVTLVAGVGGPFVHGERAFMVAWIYTGGAVALPALLVTWMVARRELGSMPGGRAWCFGLVWVYIDGLALLYMTARPDNPLRPFTVPAVLPPIVLFGVAAIQLSRSQRSSVTSRQLILGALFGTAAVCAVTALLLGDSIASSDAAWLARPAALVAAVLTAGSVASGWYHAHGDRADVMTRLGLAVLATGATNSWSVVAQAVSGFSLPSSPFLALQAVTMGFLLLIPIHAPRLVTGSVGKRSAIEIASQEWFAEAPDENGVLPRRLRRPAIAYVVVTAPLVGIAGSFIHGRSAFLIAWVYTSAVYTTPAMVVTWAAARRTRYQATAWRLWFGGVVALYLNGAALLLTTVSPGHAIERLGVLAVVPCIVLFGAAGVAMMRARSGARAMSVDVIETAIVIVVILFAVVLLAGDQIWRADARWFALPTALVALAVTSGLIWTLIMHTRVQHANRDLESLGIALAVVGTIDAWAMLAQGISGFTLPSAPLLLLQALAMGLLLLLPLHVPRVAPAGLERLPAHAQVRHGWVVVAFTLVGLPALFAQALLSQERLPWAPVGFGVVVMILLVLAMVRQLLAINETRRLYRIVTEAAQERRRLLADVMRSVEEDRHRVASELHDQAIFSYVAFDSMNRSVADARPDTGSVLVAGVSAQLRDDLADQAESLRQLMLAVRPLQAFGPHSHRLTSPIRAYVDSLYGDVSAPTLRVEVDDDIQLDWTTETISLRIVQEAIGNVWRHARATEVRVSFAVVDDVLEVTVVDDGVGFDPAGVPPGSGLTTMSAFAALAGAELTVESEVGDGTTVRLRLGAPVASDVDEPSSEPRPPGAGPHLSLAREP